MNDDSYDTLMQQAISASRTSDIEMALGLFRRASACEPSSGVPHLLIGAELAQSGRFEEAEAAFAQAVLLSPELTIARFQLGLLQFSGGRVAVAMISWQPLLTNDPADPLACFVRGFAALTADDFNTAVAQFNDGMRKNTNNVALNSDIAKVVKEIQNFSSRGGSTTGPGIAQSALQQTRTDASPTEEHVLLANYQRQGLPH